jgi:type II secretory pathway pseudopilin PulG
MWDQAIGALIGVIGTGAAVGFRSWTRQTAREQAKSEFHDAIRGELAEFKERIRTDSKEEIHAIVRAELAVFKGDLMTTLNGTYLRSETARARLDAIERRVERLEER